MSTALPNNKMFLCHRVGKSTHFYKEKRTVVVMSIVMILSVFSNEKVALIILPQLHYGYYHEKRKGTKEKG